MVTIIVLFVVSQVLIAGAVWIGLKIAAREPRLVSRLAAVTELTHRPTRIEVARHEEARTKGEMEAVEERLVHARQRLADLITVPEGTASATGFAILAFICYEGEAALALLLNLAARLGNMADGIAAFFSPLAAAAVIAALHVILGAIISIGARHRPERIERRAKIGAGITGSLVFVGVWAVLSPRSFTEVQFMESVAAWGLMALALFVSIAGAFSLLVATTRRDERALEDRVSRLERVRTALGRHLEAVRRDLQQQDRPITGLSGEPRPVGVTGAILAVLLLLSTTVDAQPELPSAINSPASIGASSTVSSRPSLVVPGSCEKLLDVSLSLDAGRRQQAVEELVRQLDTIITVYDCRVFRVSGFSGEAPFNSLHEVVIPTVPNAATCENSSPTTGPNATKRAIELLYPRVAAAHHDDAVRACLAREHSRRNAALAERGAAIDTARQLLLEASRTRPRGSCTALYFAIERALRRSQHVLSLTDGADTCGPMPPRLVELQQKQTATFLLLPSTVADAPQFGLQLARQLEAVYPAARVIFFGELTPSFWKTLGPRN